VEEDPFHHLVNRLLLPSGASLVELYKMGLPAGARVKDPDITRCQEALLLGARSFLYQELVVVEVAAELTLYFFHRSIPNDIVEKRWKQPKGGPLSDLRPADPFLPLWPLASAYQSMSNEVFLMLFY